jgi:hypothetical protein
MRKSIFIIGALVGLCFIVAIYEALLFYFGFEISHEFEMIWRLVFVVLLTMWIDVDSRHRKEVYRPFDFGFLVLVFWIPYVPYYLIRTRRMMGLLALLGLIFLYYLGYLLQWAIYYSS